MAIDLSERAAEDLEELLAATATSQASTRKRRKLGGREAPGNDAWVAIPGGAEMHLTRSIPFTVWEGRIFEPYGAALRDLEGVPDAVARAAETDVLPRAIAVQVGGEQGPVVEEAIRFLLDAAATTYEGQSVSLSIALDLDDEAAEWAFPSLRDYAKNDWFAVLGSGAATAVTVDRRGRVVQLVDMHHRMGAVPIPPNALYPDAFRYLGSWAVAGARRVALSLTRSRELLIQESGFLRYIYRSGRWRALPVDNATGIGWCENARISPDVKKAVLASAIDASLAHHGGCIAVIAPGHLLDFNNATIVDPSDRWPANSRSGLFNGSNFLALTRRERIELLSMDGATVLDRSGEILAAGAIVQVPGGSPGGGRLAATLALARYGAALKISQDGPIRLFGRRANAQVAELMRLA